MTGETLEFEYVYEPGEWDQVREIYLQDRDREYPDASAKTVWQYPFLVTLSLFARLNIRIGDHALVEQDDDRPTIAALGFVWLLQNVLDAVPLQGKAWFGAPPYGEYQICLKEVDGAVCMLVRLGARDLGSICASAEAWQAALNVMMADVRNDIRRYIPEAVDDPFFGEWVRGAPVSTIVGLGSGSGDFSLVSDWC